MANGEGSAHPKRVSATLVAAIAVASLSLRANVAEAALLDEPPKVVRMKLDDPEAPSLTLLRPFFDASVERPGLVRLYLGGPWGHWGHTPWWQLAWVSNTGPLASIESLEPPRESDTPQAPPFALSFASSSDASLKIEEAEPTWLRRLDPEWAEPALLSTGHTFASNGFDALWEPKPKPVPWSKQCRRRPVTFVRYGAEHDTFPLVTCDGSVATFAIDRLSLIARPPEVPRFGDLLPDEPDPDAWSRGEWLPSVHLMNPRLLWALQKIADAFPRRVIYIFSGYRPRTAGAHRGGHHSMHNEGRAMDISVTGVANRDLFKFCHTLDDVGCGYYPNSKFVHVDVRRPGTGHAFWIDTSAPSEPSHYVDSWPGVIDAGGLAWDGRRDAGEPVTAPTK
jgi:hypothetical protein